MIRKTAIAAAAFVGILATTAGTATAATLPHPPIKVIYCVVKTFEGTIQPGTTCYSTKAQATSVATAFNTVVARQCSEVHVPWVCGWHEVVVPKITGATGTLRPIG